MAEDKLRYSDEELEEFRALINEKLAAAEKEYALLKESMTSIGNDVGDTSPTFKALEEGATTLNKESMARMAMRQYEYIQKLKAALIRIENKRGKTIIKVSDCHITKEFSITGLC